MSSPDPLHFRVLPGLGLFRCLRELALGRETPLLYMQVEVSSVCACHCTYCPQTVKKAVWHSRLMADQTFAALWPLMRQCARVHLQGWGDPFLHTRFLDFVRVARRAGCAVSTTCGLRIDEALAEAIVDSGMDVVAFSLAGTDEASNASRWGIPFARVEYGRRPAGEQATLWRNREFAAFRAALSVPCADCSKRFETIW